MSLNKHFKVLDTPFRHHFRKMWSISFLMLLCALLGAGVTIILPGAFAAHAASAAITVTPTSGPYTNRDDQTPIAVQGSNFGANETVNVYWNYTGPSTGIQEATATTNANGAFSASFQWQLAATGTYTIAGVGQTSGDVATALFTLLPQLSVRAQAGGPGSPSTVYGNAFGAGETVKIYWGSASGKLLATATGDSNGSFTANVTIPANATPGFYNVVGVGQSSTTTAKYKYTIYSPTLALAPMNGSASTELTISAYGFTGLEDVDVFWNNGTTPVASSTTSGYGYLTPTRITVPADAAPGSYAVKVVGRTSHLSISNTYTVVAPSSSLNITSGPVGVKVKVNVQGYAPNETVNILWNYTGPATGTKVASVTAGYSGTIQASFGVPAATSGAYTVAAVGATSNAVTQNTFTLGNGIAASPASVSPGKSVTINGTGYQVGELVQIYLNSTSGKLLATATANAKGNINQSVTIPSTATPGSHSVIAVGQTSGQSLTTSVTVNTNWGDFGFDNQHDRNNIYEHVVGTGNVTNLKLKWSATVSAGLEASPVAAKGIVYIPTMDGFLNAYDALSGTLKWQFNCQCIFRSFSSPLVDSATDLVFFGTVGYADEGIPSPFYGLDAQTGTLQWSVILNWHQLGFPTLAFNTLYVGTSHMDHNSCSIYAIDEISGRVNWQYYQNSGFWGAVAADPNTNTVFTGVGNPGAAVVALNATTGALIWNRPIPQFGTDDDVGSGISVVKGLVYASSKNGSVYALNESSGAIVWATPIGGQSNSDISSPAVSLNGTLYAGSMNKDFYALNATTGAILWKTTTGANSILSSPAIANGVVYFGAFDRKIYALDAKTGAVLWSYATGNSSYSSPIFLNGWLYCGSSDGKLYAFGL